jgi:hypothetical protein
MGIVHHRSSMKLCLAAAVSGLAMMALLASVKLAEAIKETSPHALLQHPIRFHQAKVIVKGTASHVEVHIPRRGAAALTFTLTEPDNAASVTVVSRRSGTVREGVTVSIEGVFDKTTGRIVAYSIREHAEDIEERPQNLWITLWTRYKSSGLDLHSRAL